jgi:cytochrome c oxidase subunit 1
MLGMPRRVSSYNADLHTLNVFVSISAFCLGLSMLIFLYNLVWSLLFKRERAADNPWESKSLEWQLPTPVPVYNFEQIPTITGDPYGYGSPDTPTVDFGRRRAVAAGEAGA